MHLSQKSKLLRNFTFGVEDSLVSTVGVLSGVAIAEQQKSQIILTGLILISVEAFSMAVGSLLTEQTADEFRIKREVSILREIPSSLVMFVSYFLSGLIPLSPYLILEVNTAFKLSVVLSLIALVLLGVFSARIARVSYLKAVMEMVLLGGLAVTVGVAIGRLF